jgi:hypothetical protein
LPLTRFRGALFRPLRHATAGEITKVSRWHLAQAQRMT